MPALSPAPALRYVRPMPTRLLPLALLLLLAACGGSSDTPGSANTGAVSSKAVADVDAAMADAQRTRTATAPQPVK